MIGWEPWPLLLRASPHAGVSLILGRGGERRQARRPARGPDGRLAAEARDRAGAEREEAPAHGPGLVGGEHQRRVVVGGQPDRAVVDPRARRRAAVPPATA